MFLKKLAVWVIYLAICTGLLFLLPLGPIPALALYMAGYFICLHITGKMGKTEDSEAAESTEE